MAVFEERPKSFLELINALVAPRKIESVSDLTQEQAVSIIVETIESMTKASIAQAQLYEKTVDLYSRKASTVDVAEGLKYAMEMNDALLQQVADFNAFLDAMFGKPE